MTVEREISSLAALVDRWMEFTKQLDTELLTLRADVAAIEHRLAYGAPSAAPARRKLASPVASAAHRDVARPITPPGTRCDA